ncbi:MAG: hypothetical protein JSU90_07255, partial [Nitrospiraceae bacterium]
PVVLPQGISISKSQRTPADIPAERVPFSFQVHMPFSRNLLQIFILTVMRNNGTFVSYENSEGGGYL